MAVSDISDAMERARCELVENIAEQLRTIYLKKYSLGEITLFSLAEKLNISSTYVENVLSGKTRVSIKDLSDFVWAMDLDIEICMLPKNNSLITYR